MAQDTHEIAIIEMKYIYNIDNCDCGCYSWIPNSITKWDIVDNETYNLLERNVAKPLYLIERMPKDKISDYVEWAREKEKKEQAEAKKKAIAKKTREEARRKKQKEKQKEKEIRLLEQLKKKYKEEM